MAFLIISSVAVYFNLNRPASIFVTETDTAIETPIVLSIAQSPNPVVKGGKVTYTVATGTTAKTLTSLALAFNVNSSFTITSLNKKYLPSNTVANNFNRTATGSNKIYYLLAFKTPTSVPANTVLFTIDVTAPTTAGIYNNVVKALNTAITPKDIISTGAEETINSQSISSLQLTVN